MQVEACSGFWRVLGVVCMIFDVHFYCVILYTEFHELQHAHAAQVALTAVSVLTGSPVSQSATTAVTFMLFLSLT